MHDKKILIIDDDVDFLHLASLLFEKEGAQTFRAHDGLDGLIKLFTHQPDLIILDVLMPGPDGFEVCKRMQKVSDAPIIMVTAINDEDGRLRGLASGADVFLSKPFNLMLLLARAKAILHHNGRAKAQITTAAYKDEILSIDFERRDVFIRGKRIRLTPVELRILDLLVRHEGKILTCDHILTHVWDNKNERNLDRVYVYISYLRQKLEVDPKDPRHILTVRGMGYTFDKNVRSLDRSDA
jgi:DNA-binding response OmpR family regulator